MNLKQKIEEWENKKLRAIEDFYLIQEIREVKQIVIDKLALDNEIEITTFDQILESLREAGKIISLFTKIIHPGLNPKTDPPLPDKNTEEGKIFHDCFHKIVFKEPRAWLKKWGFEECLKNSKK